MKALNKDKTLEILKPYLELGYSVNKACKLTNIEHSTVYKWMKEDSYISSKIASLRGLVSQTARRNIIDQINAGDVKLSQWWLERQERDEFHLNTKQVDDNPHNKPVSLLGGMSNLASLQQELEEKLGCVRG